MLPRLAPGPASRAQPPRFTGNAPRAHEKKKAKVMCAGRESNSGLVRGRDVYYHCTTGADSTVARDTVDPATPSATPNAAGSGLAGCTHGFKIGSYGAMAARWIPDPKVGGSNPSSFTPFFGPFFLQSTIKKKVHCRNWESHPGCRGHNAESCY